MNEETTKCKVCGMRAKSGYHSSLKEIIGYHEDCWIELKGRSKPIKINQ